MQIVFFPFVFPSSVESAIPLWLAIISSCDVEVQVDADDDIADCDGDVDDGDDDNEYVGHGNPALIQTLYNNFDKVRK